METEDEFWSSILGLLPAEEEETAVDECLVDSSDSSTEALRPRRRRRVRVTLKTQLDELRERCADLEAQRQRLGRLECRDEGARVRHKRSTRRVEVWKNLAMRQYSHRRESETENERLKRKVLEQTRLLQHLVRLAQRCQDTATTKPSPRSMCFEFTSTMDVSAKSSLRDDLINSSMRFFNAPDELARLRTLLIDAHKQEVAAAFTDYPSNRHVLPATWAVAPGVTVVHARLLPYEYRACAEAIWDQFAGDVCEMHPASSAFSRGFETLLHDPLLPGRYVGMLAGQRTVRGDQSVITWAVELSTTHSTAEAMTFRVYGCHVVSQEKSGAIVVSKMVTFTRGDCWTDLKRRARSRIVQFSEKSANQFQDLLQRRLDGVAYAMRPPGIHALVECSD